MTMIGVRVDTPCVLWTGAVSSNGYGSVIYNGRKVTAHNAALQKKLGRPLRPGHESCHTCDVRLCINPDHLWEGTRAENLADMRAKGRGGAGSTKGMPKPAGFGEKQSIAQRTTRMRTCSCGWRTNAGAMAWHKRRTGHA